VEPELPIDDVDHYFVGLTPQSSAGGLARIRGCDAATLPASIVYPVRPRLDAFAEPIMQQLRADSHVRDVLMRPVLGHYGISRELSVGLEVRASAGFDAAALAASVFGQACVANQTDAFVGRVLKPAEWTDNARPGLTVLLKTPTRMSAITSLLRQIVESPGDGWPIDGFTTIPAHDGRIGVIEGLRYLFLPEISIRWDARLRDKLRDDDEAVDILLLDQATRIGRLCIALQRNPDVAAARLNWFDVIVAGIEEYASVIVRLLRDRARPAARRRDSMAHTAFSEMLDLTSGDVLRARVARIDRREEEQRAARSRPDAHARAGLPGDAAACRAARIRHAPATSPGDHAPRHAPSETQP